ncbi:hypothetical protein [Paenarthrobacter sp. CAP02]|uniref:hypothetical protein n=1 Tax=Paenarthrobacter sp. CAP02 TaxID=3158144 RepID=UPI0032DBC1DC
MSTERDELAERIRGEISHHISPVIGWLRLDAEKGRSDEDGKRHDAWLERLDKAAEAVAELTKPRTITTTEELDALPHESIILDAKNVCREGLTSIEGRNWWRTMGPARVLPSREVQLPATVLHEGAES